MARGLTINPIGSPYTLQANPVGFNYLLYSRQMINTATGTFTLNAGALSFAYTLQPMAFTPPITLALSPLGFAYTLEPATLGYTTSFQITTTSLPNATVNGSYFYQLAASGGQPPYQWGQIGPNYFGGFNYSVNVPVASITSTTNAVITLTSSAVTHPFAGQTQCMIYPIIGSWPVSLYQSGAITSLTGSQGAWVVNTNMDFDAAKYATDALVPCALVAGPTGVNPYQVTASGMLEVAPTTAETASLPLIVTDNTGATATVTLSITVNTTLAIMGCDLSKTTQPLPQAMVGNSYSHQMLSAGGTGTPAWTGSGLPSGLSISTTGLITGIPLGASSFTGISITVTSGPNNASYVFSMVVLANANAIRPSYNTGTGFFVLNGQIYDPNGAPFRIRGFDQGHYDSGTTNFAKTLGANTVRIMTYLVGQSGYTASTYVPIVSNTIAADMVPMLCIANVPGPGITSASVTGTSGQISFSAVTAQLFVGNTFNVSGTNTGTGTLATGNYLVSATNGTTTATLTTTGGGAITTAIGTLVGQGYAHSGTSGNTSLGDLQTTAAWLAANYSTFAPYQAGMMINIINEWDGPGNNAANWQSSYENVVPVIRAGGWTCPIVIDANEDGQSWQTLVSSAAGVLATDPQQNCIFSFHAYGQCQNQQAQITGITTGSSSTVVHINYTGPYNPFQNFELGNSFNDVPTAAIISGVSGMTQINGLTPAITAFGGTSGAYTVTLSLNSSAFSAYSSGGTIYSIHHVTHSIAPAFGALASSNVCCIFGECAPGKLVGTDDGSPTITPFSQMVAACEANGIGWLYWAIDDNDLSSNSTSQRWFGSLLTNSTYTNPTSLTYVGLDAGLNPNTGAYGLATPASYFVGGSTAQTFKYYVSTTGSDSNNGLTPATAWAFTSFNNSGSANNALMAGQRVGLLPGTYRLSQLTSGHTGSGDYTWSQMNLPGGTSTSQTYIASCNSSGIYTPRVAIILVDTLTINGCIGGGGGQVGGGTASYITVDGLTVNGNNIGGGDVNEIMHLIGFWGSYSSTTSSNAASETGIIVQNCELYGIKTTTHNGGQNSAGVWFEGCYGCIVQNNYIHDIGSTASADQDHTHAIEEYGCHSNQYIYNTIANCSSGFESKLANTGTICAYNYFFNVAVGQGGAASVFEGFDGGTGNPNTGPAPVTYLLHHNVIDGCSPIHEADINTSFIAGPLNCYNNTVYDTTTGATGGWQFYATTNVLNFYNNIYYSVSSTGGGGGKNGKIVAGAGGYTTLDYNCYFQAASNYATMWGLNTTGYSTLLNWQSATSAEAHSFTSNPTFATSYVAGNGPNQFQLGGGSPCLATGQSGDNMGAWDGTATANTIGANWVAAAGVYPITADSEG